MLKHFHPSHNTETQTSSSKLIMSTMNMGMYDMVKWTAQNIWEMRFAFALDLSLLCLTHRNIILVNGLCGWIFSERVFHPAESMCISQTYISGSGWNIYLFMLEHSSMDLASFIKIKWHQINTPCGTKDQTMITILLINPRSDTAADWEQHLRNRDFLYLIPFRNNLRFIFSEKLLHTIVTPLITAYQLFYGKFKWFGDIIVGGRQTLFWFFIWMSSLR